MPQLTILGSTEGGRFGMYSQSELEHFCKMNPNEKITITISTQDNDKRKRLLAYYKAKVVPEWKQRLFDLGVINRSYDVDSHLKKLSPITKEKELSELSYGELKVFMDTVKMYSLRDVQLFIEDCRII